MTLSNGLIPDSGSTSAPYYGYVVFMALIMRCIDESNGWENFPVCYAFVTLPILEIFLGVDLGNQSKPEQKSLQKDGYFALATYMSPLLQTLCNCYGAWRVNQDDMTPGTLVGISISMGLLCGACGFVNAHELSHKASLFERLLAKYQLCQSTYGVFYIEHTVGHHKNVAIPEIDPATAKAGESFWAFLPRVVYGEITGAYKIEAARLKRNKLAWYHNEFYHFILTSGLMMTFLVKVFGNASAPYMILHSIFAVILFETVNYAEHYGLERAEISPGEYARVQPEHSWDSPQRFTTHLLIKLQRHADHHANAGKRYQILQLYEDAAQAPAGYATTSVMCLISPLWFAVMNPRVLAHRERMTAKTGQVWRNGPKWMCPTRESIAAKKQKAN